MKTPTKLLVANRSEIACRIFQACRELGIQTVAIVAPGDESGRHVTYADEVQTVSNYLDIESIVSAAKNSSAMLIHPGYGFLSERPNFVSAIQKAGLTFIGPSAESMRAMGEKIPSKELAEKHKVPTLPWVKLSTNVSTSELKAHAEKIGFPLLLKASSGGGGKGMRKVEKLSELESAAAMASSEAKASFGAGELFMEKFLESPRHIEVQIFGDGKGEAIHLFERECSLQRRHQKIWEEAAAPHLSEKTKKGLYEAALRVARATNYQSAGTVEFIVDAKENFYFLEMNTRLQVEHPVTELITGLDLVHLQILQALKSKEASLDQIQRPDQPLGHAIEVRLYAEDPSQSYMPCTGTLTDLRWPTGVGIRIDSGIEKGQKVSVDFDPMLAKLIVSAPNRKTALARLRYALEETVVFGVGTNQAFLRALCDHKGIQDGKMDTGLLSRDFSDFTALPDTHEQELLATKLQNTAPASKRRGEAARSPWQEFGAQP